MSDLSGRAPGAQGVGHRWRLWRPFVIAALVLLVLEIAARKVVLPETWRRRLNVARQDAAEAEPAYEELRARIARMRQQHLEALRNGFEDPDDPAARAHLHVARRARAR